MSIFASLPLGNYGVKPQTGFTSSLLDKLVVSRSKVEEWVQHEKAKADKVAEAYRQQLMQEQAQIDTKVTNLLAVQLERGLSVKNEGEENDENAESIAKRKVALEEQRNMLESEVEKLQTEYQTREKRVKEITMEEAKQRERAQSAKALKAKVEESKRTTVDDLTRGVVNYKFTGLDFAKTDVENELRFSFTNLDPKKPSRKFSFLLQVDGDDKYEIADCQPAIDAAVLVEVANVLNDTDDMSFLVRRMRRAFTETL
mmetsp:Transcript_113085/g.316008  ORF Transcript_113085/g.316008 Transcript_113085/m.316008 type:complete len:257 (+) Transcript_113085:84-854(+)